jgi:hypothetical protein
MRTFRKTLMTTGVFTLMAGIAFSAAGCGETITGSGRLTTETYDFAGFTDVDVRSAFEVEIANGDDYAVEVTVDDNIVDRLEVKLDGKTLFIGMEGPHTYLNTTQEAAVTMPALSRLELSGASSAAVGGFASDGPLELDLSGASSLDCSDMRSGSASFDLAGASSVACSDMETGDATFDLAGTSSVESTGSAADIDVKAAGASKVLLSSFAVEDADVDLAGKSEATVNASGTLTGDLKGSSKLVYVGAPTLGEIKTSSSSTVERG